MSRAILLQIVPVVRYRKDFGVAGMKREWFIELAPLQPQIDVFKRLYAVAGGDIVLVVEFVGTVAGGPYSLDARPL